MMNTDAILYIKPGCPWCQDALRHFQREGIRATVKDVLTDREAMARMREISGQSLTPTFEYGDFVVADFSVEEFQRAIERHPKVLAELRQA